MMSGNDATQESGAQHKSDSERARTALLEHTLLETDGRLEGAIATLAGEADELAARRPHPDAHLYDVEEQLRWKANRLREWRDDRDFPRI